MIRFVLHIILLYVSFITTVFPFIFYRLFFGGSIFHVDEACLDGCCVFVNFTASEKSQQYISISSKRTATSVFDPVCSVVSGSDPFHAPLQSTTMISLHHLL